MTSAPVTLRHITPVDVPVLAALNDAAAPAVNLLGVDGLRAHLPACEVTVAAERGGGLVGFALALAPGAAYASENYQWFSTNRPGSLYLDRIVVAPAAHGQGIGRALHEVLLDRAGALGLGEVTCEVNLEPANPGSVAFHSRLGFREVGRLDTKGGSVRVLLLARAVPGAVAG